MPLNSTSDHNEALQDVVGSIPSRILRFGSLVIFLVLMLFAVLSYVIKYPDIIEAPTTLNGVNLPKSVGPKMNAKIIKILVKEGDSVEAHTPLAYLESVAEFDQVISTELLLKKIANYLNHKYPDSLNILNFYEYYKLGELQNEFEMFRNEFNDYQYNLSTNYFEKDIQNINVQLDNSRLNIENLKDQKKLLQEDLRLAMENYNSNKKLFDKDVIALVELKQKESFLLNKKMAFQQIETQILRSFDQITLLNTQMLNIKKNQREKYNRLFYLINTLQRGIDTWKSQYVISAPTKGKVAFNIPVQENQFVSTNTDLFYVVPQIGKYIGEIYLPQLNIGKVQVGQDVNVKLLGYSFAEYGLIKGKIHFISTIPKNNNFLVQITFPNGMVTTHHKKIEYKNGMIGNAEIITENMRIIKRIFYQFSLTI